ncbi:hypothetical protein BJ741DRAFT_705245 [Chytriomyces cf. hyalinus JEL632]|nr:hypothetical protein BJ741DRAFT_705245 [Chytriomyces cf. hyalinus JEL632]
MSWFFSAPSKAPIQTVSTTASPIATDPPAVPVKSKLELLAEFEQEQSAKRAVNTTVTVGATSNNTPKVASMSSVDAPMPATNNVPVNPASTVTPLSHTVATKKPSQGSSSTTTTTKKSIKKPSVDSTSSLKKPSSESVKMDEILDVKPKKPKSGTVAKSATKAAVPTIKKPKASKSAASTPDALPVNEALTMLPATEAVKETPKQLKRETRSKPVDPLSSETANAATAKKKLVEPNSSPKPAKKAVEKRIEPTPIPVQAPPEVVPNPPQVAAAIPAVSVLPKKRSVRVQKTESAIKVESLAKPIAPSAPALPIELPLPAVETSLLPPVFVAQSEASESGSDSDDEIDEDESDEGSSSESDSESQPIKIETPVAITAPIQLVQPAPIPPVRPAPILPVQPALEATIESSSDDDDESEDSETNEEDEIENSHPVELKIQPSPVAAVAQQTLPAKVVQPSITQSDSEDSATSENESSESEEEDEDEEEVADETANSVNADKPQYPNVVQSTIAINTKDESKSEATSAQPIQQAVESLTVESSSSEEEDESEADENDSEDVEEDEDEAEESSDADVEENGPVAPPHSEIEAVKENVPISPPRSEIEALDQTQVENAKPINLVKAEHPEKSPPRDAPISMFTPKKVDNRPDIRFLQERARLPGFDYPFTFYKHPVETYRF